MKGVYPRAPHEEVVPRRIRRSVPRRLLCGDRCRGPVREPSLSGPVVPDVLRPQGVGPGHGARAGGHVAVGAAGVGRRLRRSGRSRRVGLGRVPDRGDDRAGHRVRGHRRAT
ncbi:hypothetical protein [Corynebacterium sp. HMSC14H10]|uniref:hypothetical protein n=1 Tax=Corynebacterium sp. HMSC14H10 TaxID=1581103 RepID=UPI0014393F26|nr:hypothetical protein [Corynebacterium sp. HMSC14H10]